MYTSLWRHIVPVAYKSLNSVFIAHSQRFKIHLRIIFLSITKVKFTCLEFLKLSLFVHSHIFKIHLPLYFVSIITEIISSKMLFISVFTEFLKLSLFSILAYIKNLFANLYFVSIIKFKFTSSKMLYRSSFMEFFELGFICALTDV